MESVQARYDRSVRTVRGSVIQFLYGEDGMDAVWIERQVCVCTYVCMYANKPINIIIIIIMLCIYVCIQSLRHLDVNRRQFEQRYVLDVLDDNFGQVPNRPGEFYLTEKVRLECRRDTATATLLQVCR